MLTAASGTNCSAAHIWVNKSTTGYFQVENIPLYGASKVKVSWAQGGNTTVTVQYAFDGSSSFTDLSSNSTGSAEFISTELSTSGHNSISLKFVRTSTKTNLRLDNLKLFVTEASGSSGGVTYTDDFFQQAGTHTTPTCRGKRSRYVPPAHPNKSHLHLHETPIKLVTRQCFNGSLHGF